MSSKWLLCAFLLSTIAKWSKDIHYILTNFFGFISVCFLLHKEDSPNDSEIGYYLIYEAIHNITLCWWTGAMKIPEIVSRNVTSTTKMRVKMFLCACVSICVEFILRNVYLLALMTNKCACYSDRVILMDNATTVTTYKT